MRRTSAMLPLAVLVLAVCMSADGTQVQTQAATQSAADTRVRAQQGDAEAQFNLGAMYARGQGVPQDDVQAIGWYRKAAEQGLSKAQHFMGFMYGEGRGVPRDDVQAVAWYRKAAGQGHATAQLMLGVMYGEGRGVPRDDVQAVAWYRKAAEQGFAPAQCQLGIMYHIGRGVPLDAAQAVAWYRKAAVQGDKRAQGVLDELYARGQGVPQQTPPRQSVTYGPGTISCGTWLTEHREKDVPFYVNASWVQGWMSAAGHYGRELRFASSEATNTWVDNYCVANPLSDLAAAAAGLVESLRVNVPQQTPPRQSVTYGPGTISCGTWLTEHREKDDPFYMNAGWVQGWMSAAGYYGEDLKLADSEATKAWVDNYCAANPLSDLAAAAAGLVEASRVKVGAQAPPPANPPDTGAAESTSGTAFVVGRNVVVTCNHVIKDAKRIEIAFENGRQSFPLETIVQDEANDLALLRILPNATGKYPTLTPVALARTSDVRLGEQVFTIGFPLGSLLGESPKVAEGIVSSLSGIQDDPRMFQVSVPIQPGNSGGPLFDDRGRAVAVVVASLSATYLYKSVGTLPQNVNFAVRADYVLTLLRRAAQGITPGLALPDISRVEQIERLDNSVGQVRAFR